MRAFLQGLGLILVSSGITWIIEMIIVAVDVHCGVLILLLLFIFAQVACRLHDFGWAWKGGLIFVYREVWVATPSMKVMGFPICGLFFSHRACTNYPHGIRGGSLTLKDQLLVDSTDAMNGSVRVPPWH
jgi:hypothetical protein